MSAADSAENPNALKRLNYIPTLNVMRDKMESAEMHSTLRYFFWNLLIYTDHARLFEDKSVILQKIPTTANAFL